MKIIKMVVKNLKRFENVPRNYIYFHHTDLYEIQQQLMLLLTR